MKHLLTLFIALTVFTGKAWADEPTITFIVPYKVVCEKQPDGTKQIRVKIALRKAPHQFIVNSVENLISTANPGVTIYNNTTLLQATSPCRNLSGELALTNKLYGFDAKLIGDEVDATFGVLFDAFPVDLCALCIGRHTSG